MGTREELANGERRTPQLHLLDRLGPDTVPENPRGTLKLGRFPLRTGRGTADECFVTIPAAWLPSAVDLEGPDEVSYDTDAAHSVMPVGLGLALVSGALLVLHPAAFGQDIGVGVELLTVLVLLVSLLAALVAWKWGVAARHAHGVLFAMAATAVASATAHLIESGQPTDSVPFLLLAVAIGAVMLQRGWFFSSVVVVWLGWTTAVLTVGGGPRAWTEWMFFLAVATVLGYVIHLLRRRSLDLAAGALERALRAATEDSLTTLLNRRGLAMLGTEVVAVSKRSSDAVHCSFLDVDGLKRVNDRLGHDAGDHVIVEVARAIRATSRETDVVARWGGDEFVIVGLGPGVPPRDLEQRILNYVTRENTGDPALESLRISVGRSMLEPWDAGDLESLLWAADRDMYQRRAMHLRSVPPIITLDHTAEAGDRIDGVE